MLAKAENVETETSHLSQAGNYFRAQPKAKSSNVIGRAPGTSYTSLSGLHATKFTVRNHPSQHTSSVPEPRKHGLNETMQGFITHAKLMSRECGYEMKCKMK